MKDKCLGCGKCCELYVVEVLKENLKLYQIRKGYLKTVKYKKSFHIVYNMPCNYLKDHKCSIYSNRPIQCPRFPSRSFLPIQKKINPECGYCLETENRGCTDPFKDREIKDNG